MPGSNVPRCRMGVSVSDVIRRMRGSEVDDIGEIALLSGQQRGAVERLRFHQLVELRIALRMAAAMQPVTQAGDHADCCASAASA